MAKKKRSLLREVLTSPKYDVTEFIIPVSDSRGHSTPVALRCQNRFVRAMSEILSSKKYPYKTPSDILRHALYRHIHWLHEQEPECASNLVYLDAAVEAGRRQQMHLEFTKTIEFLKSTVDQLEKADMKSEAERMIKGILDNMEDDPVDDVWRRKFVSDLKIRFGYLLNE